MMATLNYNRIAICVASIIVLWVLAAAFRSHSSLSLQDLKDIASGISVSTGFGGSSKSKTTQDDDDLTDSFTEHFEFDEAPPPAAAHAGTGGTGTGTGTGTGSSWGEGYDEYDEYDILPPGLHDTETPPVKGSEDHHQHAAPSDPSTPNKWATGSADINEDPYAEDRLETTHGDVSSGSSHEADTGSDKSSSSSSSGGKTSSSGSKGSSWFSSSKPTTWEGDLDDFKREWMKNEIGGNFDDGKELQKACAKADFTGNLVLHMMHSRGGVTNVRAGILDLVWFAILTGSHIVLPGYIIRPDATAAYNWDDESLGYYGIENMFDRDWFLHVLGKYCPQMTIYPEVDAVPSTANLTHNDLFHDARGDLTLLNTESSLLAYFDLWLQGEPEYQPAGVNLVFINKMMWYFNWLPRPKLRKEMGHLLRINPAIRDLAATAIYNMRTTHHLDSIIPGDQVYENAYYAVHLRTEADAQQMGWMTDYGDFEMQSDLYLEKCKELGLNLIYAASGSKEDIQKFTTKAASSSHNIQVVSKDDLLTPGSRTALASLTWDQQGALDWEVLSRATFFSGPVFSSFAWNIALRRHYYNEGDERLDLINPWAAQEEDPSVVWGDGLSEIVLKRDMPNPMEQIAHAGMIP